MLAELKSVTLIRGVRGQAAGDRAGLIGIVVAFSRLCYTRRDHISEIGINPVIVNQHCEIAVDALIVG